MATSKESYNPSLTMEHRLVDPAFLTPMHTCIRLFYPHLENNVLKEFCKIYTYFHSFAAI